MALWSLKGSAGKDQLDHSGHDQPEWTICPQLHLPQAFRTGYPPFLSTSACLSTQPISFLSHCFGDLSSFHPLSYQELLAHPIHSLSICATSAGSVPCLPCSAVSQAAVLCHCGADLTAQLLPYLLFFKKLFLYSSVSGENGTENEIISRTTTMTVAIAWWTVKVAFVVHRICVFGYLCSRVCVLFGIAPQCRCWKQIKKNAGVCAFYLYWTFSDVKRASNRLWYKWFEICPADPARERINTSDDF